jgi:Holliday junction DNA helicase RuvA
MIASLRGVLREREPTRVVIECQGIGFELKVPLSTSRRLGDSPADVVLLVDTYFTRSGVELYGFLDAEERNAFKLLTSVRGIGPKAGLNLLSRLSPAEIVQAVATGRVDVMKSVPGIGPKKAESIIKKLQQDAPAVLAGTPLLADAESALMSLGLTRREARERLARVELGASMTLQELLRIALAQRGF